MLPTEIPVHSQINMLFESKEVNSKPKIERLKISFDLESLFEM